MPRTRVKAIRVDALSQEFVRSVVFLRTGTASGAEFEKQVRASEERAAVSVFSASESGMLVLMCAKSSRMVALVRSMWC